MITTSEMMEELEVDGASAPWWIWTGLSVIACVSFWCQATVTEERLVPALNVISDYFHIPNDVAGATLMAAGASSPELFSSLVSLFVTHSSLGLGTIVGSEIFNQLVICAGAVYASKTGSLQLDRAIVAREVGFYALAIILLYIALQDVRPLDGNEFGQDHIFVSFWQASLVFSGYILYVLVCAYMDAVVHFFTWAGECLHVKSKTSYGTIQQDEIRPEIPVPIGSECNAPLKERNSNWTHEEFLLPEDMFDTENDGRSRSPKLRSSNLRSASDEHPHFHNAKIRGEVVVELARKTSRPTEMRTIDDIEENEETGIVRCFLWQEPPFDTQAQLGSQAWDLRWFTISVHSLSSVADRKDSTMHEMIYPRFDTLHVDKDRFIFRMVNGDPKKGDYTVMAPSRKIFLAVLEKLEGFMRFHSSLRDDDGSPEKVDVEDDDEDATSYDVHVTLIDYPAKEGLLTTSMWAFLYPLRLAIHWSIPDVRQLDNCENSRASVSMALCATFMCLVWLVIGSYAMVASLENLAELMNIPAAVIGFTVSAAGTSLPNYIASRVAAENGHGNQAVSNAFGSNTFNVMVGLGLPWLLYTSFVTKFQPYDGLPASGILESILILAIVLAVFVVLMLISGFVIHRWHGILFLLMYVAYLVYAICSVYRTE